MAKLVAGGILILVALFMLLGFFNANSEMSGPARVGTFLFLVVLPAAIGGLLVKLQFKSQRAARDSAEEQRRRAQEADILKLARREGGKLTLADVVAETSVSAETAQERLSSLMTDGFGDFELTDSGSIVYSFWDMEQRGGRTER